MATPTTVKTSNASSEYSEGSIRVLKGLEPVKQRPGMYTRTDNPLHIIQEVLDNAADEALAGYGKKIKVILHADGSVSIEDDGRGIPFGLHPEENAPVIELVFTRLHAGGKFDKGKGGAYSFSGGLHGVGVSVTNALSKRLEATSYREGQVASLVFSGGDVTEPLQTRAAGEGDRKQGTTVRTWPDAKYFESSALPMQELMHLLRSKAVLMPGVSVSLVNEKTKETQQWQYKGGLRDYLMQTLHGEPVIPLFEGEGFADANHDSFAKGEGVLIQGVATGVGLAAVAIARVLGAGAILGTSRSPDKLARLKDHGLGTGILMGRDTVAAVTRAATEGRGADVILDNIGKGALADNLDAAALCGRIVSIGRLAGLVDSIDLDKLALKRLALIGVTFRTRTAADKAAITARALDDLGLALTRGDLDPPVDRCFPLDAALAAQDYMKSNAHFGKIVLET